MAVVTTIRLKGDGPQKWIKFPLKQPKAKVIEPSGKAATVKAPLNGHQAAGPYRVKLA